MRLWLLEGHRVPPRRSQSSGRRAEGTAEKAIWNLPATRPNHVWSYDFIGSRTRDGGALRILNVVDEYTRVALGSRTIGLPPLERVLTETDFPHSKRYDAVATRPAATATIEAALMAQHGLSAVELRARLRDTLRTAFAPAVSRAEPRRVGRLLRGEATAVED